MRGTGLRPEDQTIARKVWEEVMAQQKKEAREGAEYPPRVLLFLLALGLLRWVDGASPQCRDSRVLRAGPAFPGWVNLLRLVHVRSGHNDRDETSVSRCSVEGAGRHQA